MHDLANPNTKAKYVMAMAMIIWPTVQVSRNSNTFNNTMIELK